MSLLISCGKKSDSDDPKEVTSTPPISAEDPDNVIENDRFSVTSDKEEYAEGEAILLRVKNLGKASLDNLAFKIGAEPSNSIVSNLNCFGLIEPGKECMFSIVLQNPKIKFQKINITYDQAGADIRLQLNIKIIVDEQNPDIHFLYRKEHTYEDCNKLFKYQDFGKIVSVKYDDLCQVKAVNWAAQKKDEIETDPMSEYNDPLIDNNDHYCGGNWTLHSLQFEASEVQEVVNLFGTKKTVEIPPGESREVCVKRKLFGCKTKKVFYSRLVSANCY